MVVLRRHTILGPLLLGVAFLSSCTSFSQWISKAPSEAPMAEEREITLPIEEDEPTAVVEHYAGNAEPVEHLMFVPYDFGRMASQEWHAPEPAEEEPEPIAIEEEPVEEEAPEEISLPEWWDRNQVIALACCILLFLTVVIERRNLKRRAWMRRHREDYP